MEGRDRDTREILRDVQRDRDKETETEMERGCERDRQKAGAGRKVNVGTVCINCSLGIIADAKRGKKWDSP